MSWSWSLELIWCLVITDSYHYLHYKTYIAYKYRQSIGLHRCCCKLISTESRRNLTVCKRRDTLRDLATAAAMFRHPCVSPFLAACLITCNAFSSSLCNATLPTLCVLCSQELIQYNTILILSRFASFPKNSTAFLLQIINFQSHFYCVWNFCMRSKYQITIGLSELQVEERERSRILILILIYVDSAPEQLDALATR